MNWADEGARGPPEIVKKAEASNELRTGKHQLQQLGVATVQQIRSSHSNTQGFQATLMIPQLNLSSLYGILEWMICWRSINPDSPEEEEGNLARLRERWETYQKFIKHATLYS